MAAADSVDFLASDVAQLVSNMATARMLENASLANVFFIENWTAKIPVCSRRLTTQAQRPGPRDALIATATPQPGSLQRMVSRGMIRTSRGSCQNLTSKD